jgi:pimeloyl-ACP methyl ester carboxylesterase
VQSDPLTDLGRPPGRLVDIGEFRLHVWSQGTGRPPVVLEAGTWEVALAWAWILPEVAKFTQAVAYDRAGLGWSEPSRRPCTAGVMVKSCARPSLGRRHPGLLRLVGMSFGGLIVRLFAHPLPRARSPAWCWLTPPTRTSTGGRQRRSAAWSVP